MELMSQRNNHGVLTSDLSYVIGHRTNLSCLELGTVSKRMCGLFECEVLKTINKMIWN